MGQDVGIFDVVNWVSYIFPSLSGYGKLILSLLFFTISAVGILTHVIPEPGEEYPVPEMEDLDILLEGRGKIINTLSHISVWSTRLLNRFIVSKSYVWFYAVVKFSARVIGYFKGGMIRHKFKPISSPTPIKLQWFVKDKKEQDS